MPAWHDDAEASALVAAPDTATWFGRRDRALLLVALQTGLRVSELINLSRDHADMRLIEEAMDQTRPIEVPAGRYRPPDDLIAFLDAL